MSSKAVRGAPRRARGVLAVGSVACGLLLAVASTPGDASAAAPGTGSDPNCPWVGSTAPVGQRVDAVLDRMTLSQKFGLLAGNPSQSPGYAGYVPGIPELCVPALKLEDNGSGVGDGAPDITAFPDGEAAAATWNTPLIQQYGVAVGQEQKAKGTNVVLGPMINVMRDPRWGRNYETFSEDPYLTARMGVAEIDGLQSQGVIANAKHIGAYMQEANRQNVNSVLSRKALEEVYQAPFQAAVQQGHVGSIMAAADYTNGVYDNADPLLLDQDLKSDWGFDGFTVSDWDGAHSVAASSAGLDMSMPQAGNFGAPLQAAVRSGAEPVADINDHVARILTAMFQQGLFEHPDTGSLSAPARTPADVTLAQQVSQQSTVLLKNAQHQLPLDAANLKSIAVIGQAGSAQPKAVGCGSGAVSPRPTSSRRCKAFKPAPVPGCRSATPTAAIRAPPRHWPRAPRSRWCSPTTRSASRVAPPTTISPVSISVPARTS